MNWIKRNSRLIIKTVYILPILIAAGISISHVITWYGLTNPISWATYLSIGVEVAALSALAGITTRISKWAYLPFIIVTFIQLVGNIFYAYQYIDMGSKLFQDWVDLVGWLYGHGDLKLHRRILAILGGAFIPMISLSFLHLLVSFTNVEKDREELNEQRDVLTDDTKTDIEENTNQGVIIDEMSNPINQIGRESENTVGDEEVLPMNNEELDITNNNENLDTNNSGKNEDSEGDSQIDVAKLVDDFKKKKENKKVTLADIKGVEKKRKFSVKVPPRNNLVERIGSNKLHEITNKDKVIYKKK